MRKSSGWRTETTRQTKQKARQNQTTTASFTGSFEVGLGWFFLEISAGKGTRSTRIPRRRLRASRARGDPDGLEAFGGHRRPTRSGRERCPVLSENFIRAGIRIMRQNHRMIGPDACNPELTRNVHRRLVQVTVPA